MEITRQVILDLLPLYLADEVSEETRDIIERYLKSDPQLAKIAKESASLKLTEDVPPPLTQDDSLMAYRKARRAIIFQVIIVSAAISIIFLMVILLMFFSSSSSTSSPSSATVASITPETIASPVLSATDTITDPAFCCEISWVDTRGFDTWQ